MQEKNTCSCLLHGAHIDGLHHGAKNLMKLLDLPPNMISSKLSGVSSTILAEAVPSSSDEMRRSDMVGMKRSLSW